MAANVAGAKGALDGAHQSYTIAANDQLTAADAYRNIIVTYRNTAPVLLRDVADVVDGLENSKVAGFYQGMPAVVVDIQRQPGANVIETVRRINNELPKLQRSMPIGATLTVVHDATASIRASVRDVQFALTLTIAVVTSAVVSLTLTPMMCSRLLRHQAAGSASLGITRIFHWAIDGSVELYRRSLDWVLRHETLTLLVTAGTLVATVWLYIIIPKGFLPLQDTGLIFAVMEGGQDISFTEMKRLQATVENAMRKDA